MAEARRYKYPLQLPESLKEAATRLAKEDGVSLNQWIVAAVAQKIGAVESAAEFLKRRAEGADLERMLQLLNRAPDAPPERDDELD